MLFKHAKFLIFAHRGASGYAPENTISSFNKALELGADGIELDVHVCATGELVIMHDDTVDRMTNGHGYIADMSFCELKKLLVEGKEYIPTLEEVIDFVEQRVPINIELKAVGSAKLVAQLLQRYIQRGYNPANFLVSSFEFSELLLFKKLCPDVKIGALFDVGAQDIVMAAKKLEVDFVGLDVSLISKKLVEDMHTEGILVFAWTVNDKECADVMRAMQLDGIFSNYPDRMVIKSKVKRFFKG